MSAAIHCARGRLGHRPVRRVPDCEVLAALVPERVLPFASGGSRKRGPSRAEGKNLGVPRWGAERRARPLHEVRAASVFSLDEKTGERTRAASLFDAARWMRLSALRLPSFKGGVFGGLFGVAFLALSKARMRGASRERISAFAERTRRHGPASEWQGQLPRWAHPRSAARGPLAHAHRRRGLRPGALVAAALWRWHAPLDWRAGVTAK